MKKLILLILALCCLATGCSRVQAESEDPSAPAEIVKAAPAAGIASATATPMVPLISSSAVIPEQYQDKAIKALSYCGVFLQCSDPVEMAQGSHYNAYTVDGDGKLKLLENLLFNNAYTIGSGRYHFNFTWVDSGVTKLLTYTPQDSSSSLLYFSDIGSSSLFLLKDFLSGDGSTLFSSYPVLLDFESGELSEPLSGFRLSNISKISNIAISDDGKGILLAQDGGALYYCDISNSLVYSLDELSGEPVKACAMTEGKILCWNQSSSPYGTGNLGDYHFWYIDLNSFQREEMPELQQDYDAGPLRFAHLAGFDANLRSSKMFSGSPYALCTSGDGQIYVLDMAAWTLSPVSGYTMPASNVTCRGSVDGKRLLLEDLGNNSAYVIDYASSLLVRLNVQDAESLSWFDFDTVLEQPGDGNYYLYDIGI